MFAPHCPHCHSRVLLGTRRIVRTEGAAGRARHLVLRCYCGGLVVDDLGASDTTVGGPASSEAGPPSGPEVVAAPGPIPTSIVTDAVRSSTATPVAPAGWPRSYDRLAVTPRRAADTRR